MWHLAFLDQILYKSDERKSHHEKDLGYWSVEHKNEKQSQGTNQLAALVKEPTEQKYQQVLHWQADRTEPSLGHFFMFGKTCSVPGKYSCLLGKMY